MFKSAFRRGYVSSQEATTNMYYIFVIKCLIGKNNRQPEERIPEAPNNPSKTKLFFWCTHSFAFLACFLIILRQALEGNEHTFNQNMQPKPFKQQKPLRISINSLKFTSCFSPATPLLFITKQPNTARSSQSFSPQQQNVFQPHGRWLKVEPVEALKVWNFTTRKP